MTEPKRDIRWKGDTDFGSEWITVPREYKGPKPTSCKTYLAYITKEEIELLKEHDLHNSNIANEDHYGPENVISYNDSSHGGGGSTDGGGDSDSGGGEVDDGGRDGGADGGDAEGGGEGYAAKRQCEIDGGKWIGSIDSGHCDMSDTDDDDDDSSDDGGGEDSHSPDPYDVKYAAILRDQWKEYKETYFPEEDKLVDKLMSDTYGEKEAQKAKRIGMRSDNMGQAMRDIDRYGIQMSGNQMRQMHSEGQRARIGQGVQNANMTRQQMQDVRQGAMNQAVGIGHGVGGQGIGGMGQAAQMGIQRNAQMQQMGIQKQYMQAQLAMQHRSNLASMNDSRSRSRGGFGSMLGTVAGFAMGGPMGAAIGGAAGGYLFG
jgi:hypothetical protein